ncbi:MAG TPA: beta-ketoacyl-[acyl-carrier-protein] synthase family protein [Candidatus Polarisedimenticolia bacterium]|nr:beta-ketoacyl-[acyl-carrier-protein] synthase family protein [Candidatus Polarisedimenticolia bacterium]
MTPEREVFITGIGLISCLGIGAEENWSSLRDGVSGVGPVRRFDASSLRTRFAGEIPDGFDAFFQRHFPKRTRRHTARFSQLSLAGTLLALQDAGLDLAASAPGRTGICLGTGAGGLSYWEDAFAGTGTPYAETVPTLESLAVIKWMPNAPAAATSLHFGIEGPAFSVSSSCASGAQAIGCAYDLIKLGRADVMIAGAVETIVTQVGLSSFSRLQALSERNDEPARASRPFDRTRDGLVLGDGAGILVLESAAHSRRREARRHARMAGYATTSEATHMVHPAPDGRKMAETMRQALVDAQVAAADVDYISAHGTSTLLNDRCETRAIKEVFGSHARALAISSQKSMMGHTVGAAGALEAGATALMVARDVVCPTINYEHPDEECDLDYTPNVAREKRIGIALSNSFGFGGHNVTIVLSKA